ncbi:hypothetical protein [Bosea sp. AS-1]|uniref:hypothetical protein n=1 Tax=Bosea sp. AS-1 TaxID=2015316 RepID=UPI0012FE78E3|nr:hypothetical protein [Bosea sp. AS-1]
MTVLSAAALLVLAALAWRAAGWFGVGLLGLLVLFIAVRVDLEGDRPIGPQMTPGLYAEQYRSESADSSARASRRAERLSVATAAQFARLFGAALAIVGFGLFLLL